MDYKLYTTYILLLVVALILAFILVYYLIITMANKQGRETVIWLLLSFFVSPIFVIVCLALLGDTNERRREKVIEEEKLRLSLRE